MRSNQGNKRKKAAAHKAKDNSNNSNGRAPHLHLHRATRAAKQCLFYLMISPSARHPSAQSRDRRGKGGLGSARRRWENLPSAHGAPWLNAGEIFWARRGRRRETRGEAVRHDCAGDLTTPRQLGPAMRADMRGRWSPQWHRECFTRSLDRFFAAFT